MVSIHVVLKFNTYNLGTYFKVYIKQTTSFFPEFNNGLPFQSSNLKQKAEQAATRTDTIYTDATENKRQLNEDIIPGIERAMVDVEGVAAKNKMVKQSDDSLSK